MPRCPSAGSAAQSIAGCHGNGDERAAWCLIALPACQSLTNVSGIEIERMADIFEREDPGIFVSVKPLTGFSEETSSPSIGGKGVALITADGFFQNRQDEASFSF